MTATVSRTLTWMLWQLVVRLAFIVAHHALHLGLLVAGVLVRLGVRLARQALQHGPVLAQSAFTEGRARWDAYQTRRRERQEVSPVAVPTASRYCGQCGARASSGVEFCPGCGLLLPVAGGDLAPAVLQPCPTCGVATDIANSFCTACGAPWSAQARSRQPMGPVPAVVEVAAVLHTLAGLGVFALTLPVDVMTLLSLVGHPLAPDPATAGWLLAIGLTVGVWGLAWLGFSLAVARGLRRGRPWARTSTIVVALLWSLTGIGALVGIPLILALLALPSVNAYFAEPKATGRPEEMLPR
ncbi:MAG: zinc ribbon domain-containing protein [Chloroflexi bacterium]|nr:zinc ribbon domain-containing protein [Chloroflexota bacterium]